MRNQLPDLQKRQIEMDYLNRKWFKAASPKQFSIQMSN